ncbi:MAG: hypothetical protein J0M18_18200 [Ignavibacteria bacterium]|nr:hypothetical protein [Ignavibacteria bacterium]
MSYIYKFTILIIFSSIFISCSEEIVDVTTGDGNYYNWTVTPVSMDSVYKISAANDDVAFIAGNSSYKVTGSNIERIDFADTSFKCNGVDAFDKNNAVFWGSSTSGIALKLKVYDTGVFTSYNFTAGFPYSKIIFIDKNKFYFASETKYYFFDNGVLTSFDVPAAETAKGFGKVGGSIYLFTSFYTSGFSQDRAYRLAGNNLLLVSNVASQGRIHFLNNDVVRVTQDSTNHVLDYFNGSDWVNFFSFPTPANTYYIQYLAGDTRNQFLWVWFDWNVNAYAAVFSVSAKIEQTNFPTSAITVNIPAIKTVSNYSDNTYYIIDKYRATKLVKGKLK